MNYQNVDNQLATSNNFNLFDNGLDNGLPNFENLNGLDNGLDNGLPNFENLNGLDNGLDNGLPNFENLNGLDNGLDNGLPNFDDLNGLVPSIPAIVLSDDAVPAIIPNDNPQAPRRQRRHPRQRQRRQNNEQKQCGPKITKGRRRIKNPDGSWARDANGKFKTVQTKTKVNTELNPETGRCVKSCPIGQEKIGKRCRPLPKGRDGDNRPWVRDPRTNRPLLQENLQKRLERM